MDKQSVEHPYNEIPLGDKKKQTRASHGNMDGFQKQYVKWKKQDIKELHTLWLHLQEILEKANL